MNGFRLLLVEDSEDDAFLLLRALKKGGLDPNYKRVDSESAVEEALRGETWDMVITDHSLPGFTSFRVLEVVRQCAPDLPVIIVSGLIGEAVAVSAMKAGAQDYIMKDNLARLTPAVNRELRETSLRMARKQAVVNQEREANGSHSTALASRSEFESRLGKVLTDAEQPSKESVILHLDVEQFEVIQVTFGLDGGQTLINQVASLVDQRLRATDTIAHFGGGKLRVLLQGYNEEAGRQLADDVLQDIGGRKFSLGSSEMAVSIRLGMDIIKSHHKTARDLRIA